MIRRVIKRVFQILFDSDIKRCDSISSHDKRCIKELNHLMGHEDAWRKKWR